MLARIALRIAAVEALKGATEVGDNVLDSEIGSLDFAADGSLRSDAEKPFISVYTENSLVESGLELRALNQNGLIELLLEIGYAAPMSVTNAETGASEIVGMGIPATDANFEFFLDVVERQIVNALTDPRNEWAEIWRSFVPVVRKVERKRTADATSTRIAAHQIVMSVDVLPDPLFGAEVSLGSAWAKLLQKMEATNHPHLDSFLDLLGTPDGILTHEMKRRDHGLLMSEARAMLDVPPPGGEETEPVIMSIALESERG